jgi:DNA-binding XRE family transcriptional regulator
MAKDYPWCLLPRRSLRQASVMLKRGWRRTPQKDLKVIQSEANRIGVQLQGARISIGLTQESLAELLDVNVNTVKFVEQGRRIPSLPMLIRFARALKLSIALIQNRK